MLQRKRCVWRTGDVMHLRARKPQFDLKNTLHSKYAYKLAVAMAPHTLLVPLDHLAIRVHSDEGVLVLRDLDLLGPLPEVGDGIVGQVERRDPLNVAEGDSVRVKVALVVVNETEVDDVEGEAPPLRLVNAGRGRVQHAVVKLNKLLGISGGGAHSVFLLNAVHRREDGTEWVDAHARPGREGMGGFPKSRG